MITETILSRLFARFYPTKIFTALHLLIPHLLALFFFLHRKRRNFRGTRISINPIPNTFIFDLLQLILYLPKMFSIKLRHQDNFIKPAQR